MTTLRFILGDQLSRGIASLSDLDPARDIVLMVEAADETTYVAHHKQKIVFILSAMRHFAEDLRREGIVVDYVTLEDTQNTGSFTTELSRAVARHGISRVVVTEPGEWRVLEMMRVWPETISVPVEIRQDDRFFASHNRFQRWANGRRGPRMEYFYREMRRETGLLMDGAQPVGGQWNFDQDNRRSMPRTVRPPIRARFEPDAITREVIAMVSARFANHFGDLEPFGWAVTRKAALEALSHFIEACLPQFGDYQDAMRQGDVFLYHSILSPYLNVGLLLPREICAAAEMAWKQEAAPLNAVEGFIRQILGWREYIRGIYWSRMPAYEQSNALNASRPLPSFYWTGETDMNCLRQVVGDIRRTSYGQHIQRLMVTGNFALLAGIAPAEIEAWYLAVFIDAYDWVELPNVHGMVLYADGGLLASKPYAASGAYIDRMSDYCDHCEYDPAVKSGPRACPFNALYWDFLIRNEKSLSSNPRLAFPYRSLASFTAERRREIERDANAFLAALDDNER